MLFVVQINSSKGSDAFGASELTNRRGNVLRLHMAPREHLLKDFFVNLVDASAQADLQEVARSIREQYINVHENVRVLVRIS